MKAKILTWERLQEQDPKQTAIEVTYTCPSGKIESLPMKRIVVGDFQSREEAWEYCKKENIRRKVIDHEGEAVLMEVKLLRLSKIIKQLAEEEPDNAYAFRVV